MPTDQVHLKTLFVSHTYILGINQGKLDAVASTKRADVGLLVPGKWKARGWDKLYNLEKSYSAIKYYPAKVFLGGIGGGYFYSPLNVYHAIKDFKPDILQVEQEVFSLSAFELAIWARVTKIPLVVFVWENLERQLSFPRNLMSQFVLNTARLIIAGNQDGKKVLKQMNYKGEIEVMPQMGVDPNIFSPQLRQPKESQELIIGYMGRLIHRKGIDLLLSAAQKLKKNGHSFRVVLCGSGQDETVLKQQASQKNLDDIVTWKGKIPHQNVPKEMGKFDIMVLPSRTVGDWKEQFGHILIEAMSMGVPIVGSTCGEIPHVIGRSDLIFPEEDAQSLAKILERAIQEPLWLKEVSQYEIERVEQNYTHERIARRLIALWSEILKHKF